MVLVRRPFFRYDPVRCDRPMLYGTVSERAAKTILFNTLWQWKGYRRYRSFIDLLIDLQFAVVPVGLPRYPLGLQCHPRTCMPEIRIREFLLYNI